ncbi:MAG: gluconokinase [Proteobacteria bacterium]|nr:gluconokinase [Pseudomonadota bacterium]
MVIVIIGPSGCGKTTVGKLLATKLEWNFYDADDFHSSQNVEKMRQGIPLTDKDREPWLLGLAEQIEGWNHDPGNAVLACSALKKSYRHMLGVDQISVITVHLHGEFDLLAKRLNARQGHYMNPDLLQSQIDTFETPQGGITISIDQTPEQMVEEIVDKLKANNFKM